jgi:hypothetical protein
MPHSRSAASSRTSARLRDGLGAVVLLEVDAAAPGGDGGDLEAERVEVLEQVLAVLLDMFSGANCPPPTPEVDAGDAHLGDLLKPRVGLHAQAAEHDGYLQVGHDAPPVNGVRSRRQTFRRKAPQTSCALP